MVNVGYLKAQLSPNNIIELMSSLGAPLRKRNNDGSLQFTTICHGVDSDKLYYYPLAQQFFCFTHCVENFDIFDLIQKVKNYTLAQAVAYVKNNCSVKCDFEIDVSEPDESVIVEDDAQYLDRLLNFGMCEIVENQPITVINNSILTYFEPLYYEGWIEEGISIDTMKKYEIGYDRFRQQIIIPHRNKDGQLVGIRGRNLNPEDVTTFGKYTPVTIEKTMYNHPLGSNLYGIYQNQDHIKKIGKIMIYEAEKSVLQTDTMFGEKNFSVATCGSSVSNTAKDLILNMGVQEVFIGYDKDFFNDKDPKHIEEKLKYMEKLKKLAHKFINFCYVYVLWDDGEILQYKDSPSDRGLDNLLELMKQKKEITPLDFENREAVKRIGGEY